MKAVLLGVLAVVLGAGCVEPGALVCGDTVCPSDFICTEQLFCVAKDAISSCSGEIDGTPCTTRSTPGQCVSGYCVASVCGNGMKEPGEACDDNNRDSNDGCDSTCQSLEECGNGIVDVGELCDCGDGAAGHENATCTMANSDDDSATCRPNCTPHGCGDGEIENAEQCEPGIALPATATCRDLFDRYTGAVTCNNVCRYDSSGCSDYCGDGLVNDATESCDTSPPDDFCIDYGYDGGELSCSGSCRPAFAGCRRIGWIPYTLDNRQFYGVFAFSATDAWAGGTDAGRLLHWDGLEWEASTLPGTTEGILGFWGPAPNDLFALTATKIYRYNGSTWAQAATIPNGFSTFNAIGGFGSRVFAVGESGLIYSYDGNTWTTMASGTTMPLVAISVVSATEAYIAAHNEDSSMLLQWTGGAWSQKPSPPAHRIDAIYATSSSNIYIGTKSIMRWDGSRWTSIPLGVSGDVYSLHGTAANDIYAVFVGPTNTVAHFDGDSWSLHLTDTNASIARVASAGNGYAFSAGVTVARYDGTTWARTRPEFSSAINGISAAATGNVLAVGDGGLALAWDGTFWRTVPSEAGETLNAVYRNFVVGEYGVFAVYDGTRLVHHNINTDVPLNAVWAAADNDAWAAGGAGLLARWNGTSVTTSTLPGNVSIRSMWGTASNNIYAVGDNGAMVHYDGASWTPFSSGLAITWRAITGTGATSFFIGGENGEVRQWNGSAWTSLPKPTSRTITGLFSLQVNELFAVTGDSTLYVWNGSIWQNFTMPTPASFVGGRIGSAIEVYAVGSDLSLQRRVGTNSQFRAEIPTFQTGDVIRDIYAANATDIYVARTDGLYHFDGHQWTRVTYSPGFPGDVDGTGPNNVFVASGSSATIAHWNGTTFLQEPSGVTGSVTDVSAISTTDAWVTATGGSGASNSIRRFNGATWGPSTNPSSASLNTVFAVDANNAWAAGTNGIVLHFTNGAWVAETTPASASVRLFDIWASGPNDAYAVGDFNTTLHWNGTLWELADAGLTPIQDTVTGTAADDVFIGGTGASLWHHASSFTPLNPPSIDFVAAEIVGRSVYLGSRGTYRLLRLQRDVAW